MREIEKRFRTDDGREFDTPGLAERHEAMVKAQGHLEDAQRRFRRAFVETLVTADGKPFDFGQWAYYRVQNGFSGIPTVGRVSFDQWRFEYRAENGETNLLAWHEKERKFFSYPISELYAVERNAQMNCLALAKERIRDFVEDVAEMARRFKIQEEPQ